MVKQWFYAMGMIMMMCCPMKVMADELETISHLNEVAKEYVVRTVHPDASDTLEVKVALLASHQIKLARCDQPIQVTSPNQSGAPMATLEMTCAGQVNWHVYVPISMKLLTNVLVAKQTIPAKQIITRDMLDVARYDRNQLYAGYFTDATEIEGQVAAATISSGTVLTKKIIQPITLINRNQSVSIISRKGALIVKAEGIAKSNGAYNEVIKVMNASSKRLIDAVVIDGGTVEVRG